MRGGGASHQHHVAGCCARLRLLAFSQQRRRKSANSAAHRAAANMAHVIPASLRAARVTLATSNRRAGLRRRVDDAAATMAPTHHRHQYHCASLISSAAPISAFPSNVDARPSAAASRLRPGGHRWQPSSFSGNHDVVMHGGMMLHTTSSMLLDHERSGALDGQEVVEPEEGDRFDTANEGLGLPVKRSKNKNGKSKHDADVAGFDDRAKAKLTALAEAKKEADEAKHAFLSSTDELDEELHDRWRRTEQNLALAYSQAVKYTSRIQNDERATKMAEKLLYEWMDRFLEPFGGSSVWMKDDVDISEVPSTQFLNKKWMVKTVHQILPRLEPTTQGGDQRQDNRDRSEEKALPKIRIPPPASKDYINLLRAYSKSKARRKGQQCEALMRNMMRLANTVSYYYDERAESWTEDRARDVGMELLTSGGEGSEVKAWRSWVNESVPSSKAFALSIKCHASSTRPDSIERIIKIDSIHESFADGCQSHIPGLVKDDPYVLFHSIKALKNLQKEEEWDLAKRWLHKLHGFVTSADNADYFGEDEKAAVEDDGTEDASPAQGAPASFHMDVTPAYTTILRLMAKLRAKNGVAADARVILDRMHEVHTISINGFEGSDEDMPRATKRIASIGIRSNAYNLVLGLYRDSKSAEDSSKAIDLLQQMIDAGKKAAEDRGGVPLPTEQSFEFVIMSLAKMSDARKALEEAERLLELMHGQDYLESYATAYNAYIIVCNRQLHGKAQLYDKALGILDKMNEMGKTNPSVLPNAETLSLVMKAISLSGLNDHEKVLNKASDLFFSLKEREPSEKSAEGITDRAYYYMMKCVDLHLVDDPSAKDDLIHTLFSEACQRGLCSPNVLSFFRNSVTGKDYHLTVGDGRLADHWVANVKGPKALYTDGSAGGEGKHARRKGKSTSDWVKKQKAKDTKKETKRNEKKAKKLFKKIKASA